MFQFQMHLVRQDTDANLAMLNHQKIAMVRSFLTFFLFVC